MSDRDDILARIRKANGRTWASVNVTRGYDTHGVHPAGSAPLLQLLAERLRDYQATVHTCTAGDLAGVLSGITRDWRVVVPAGSAHTVPGAVPDAPPLSHAALDDVDACLTGCAAACATTGTIALDAGPSQGRRALTLLPDRHVCVVYDHQIVQTVPELVRRLDATRPLTFISGPSATSDIELNRVEGVHGPRTLIVVIVESNPSGSA